MQGLAPASPRVGQVLQYFLDRPTPLHGGEITRKAKILWTFGQEQDQYIFLRRKLHVGLCGHTLVQLCNPYTSIIFTALYNVSIHLQKQNGNRLT